jgi:hypothetical protein
VSPSLQTVASPAALDPGERTFLAMARGTVLDVVQKESRHLICLRRDWSP